MNLALLANRVLVEPIEQPETGEVVIVDALGDDQKAVGRVVLQSKRMVHALLSVGDIVYFAKGTGEEIEYHGKKYRVLYAGDDRESEILAIEYPETNTLSQSPIEAFEQALNIEVTTTTTTE